MTYDLSNPWSLKDDIWSRIDPCSFCFILLLSTNFRGSNQCLKFWKDLIKGSQNISKNRSTRFAKLLICYWSKVRLDSRTPDLLLSKYEPSKKWEDFHFKTKLKHWRSNFTRSVLKFWLADETLFVFCSTCFRFYNSCSRNGLGSLVPWSANGCCCARGWRPRRWSTLFDRGCAQLAHLTETSEGGIVAISGTFV